MANFSELWNQTVGFLSFDPSLLAEPEMALRFVIQVCLLCGSAFFSSSETALFSLSDVDLEQLRRRRNPRADLIHDLLGQPRRLIISILCGNELINIAATTNMTGLVIALYGPERAGWISVLVMVPLLLLFGEITPKSIAVTYPVQLSTKVISAPLGFWVRAIVPFRWAVRLAADRITTWIVGVERDPDHLLRISEFRSLVAEIEEQGLVSATDRVLIYNLLEAGSTEIEHIMTPRIQTDFVSAGLPLQAAVNELIRHRRLRLPVYEGTRDKVLGFIHAEDVMEMRREDLSGVVCRDIVRPCRQVPLTKTIDEMLDYFQLHNERAAMVIDEFGGIMGIITMEDVLNFIFGEIAGDFIDPDSYTKEGDHVYVVPGDMRLADFEALTNFGIEDERMTTIGGVVLRHLGRLPEEEDVVVVENTKITVLAMEGNRIGRLKAEKKGGMDEMAARPETSSQADEGSAEKRKGS